MYVDDKLERRRDKNYFTFGILNRDPFFKATIHLHFCPIVRISTVVRYDYIMCGLVSVMCRAVLIFV